MLSLSLPQSKQSRSELVVSGTPLCQRCAARMEPERGVDLGIRGWHFRHNFSAVVPFFYEQQ